MIDIENLHVTETIWREFWAKYYAVLVNNFEIRIL